jgi:LysM repeat protein
VNTPGGPTTTPVPPGVRPATYTLQSGEFPYCIARRFNVDPDQLLSLSGLTSPDIYYSGLKLTIPQSGAFPGDRALIAHPSTYTVVSSDETLYSIACKYGDVDPAAIASANGISLSASLTVGQQIKIP